MIPGKVIVTAKGDFKPGLMVWLRFGMSRKDDYYYTLFLDDKGSAQVERDKLLRSFDSDRKMFGMDCMNPREFFTGQVEAHVLSKEEIEGAIRAYDKFKRHHNYPLDYLDKLKAALTINTQSKCAISVEQIV